MPVGECPDCGALAHVTTEPKTLYNVASDEPWGDNRSDQHDRDAVYLIWMDDSDIDQLKRDLDGRVSYWKAGVIDLGKYIEEAKESLEDLSQ